MPSPLADAPQASRCRALGIETPFRQNLARACPSKGAPVVSALPLAIAGTGYGLIGLLVIILLIVLIVRVL
jgi:hypothetical protein